MKKPQMLSNLPVILTLFGLALLPARGMTEIYKWTDDSGEVQYSQTPPPAGTAVETIEGAPPPADDPDKIRQRLQRQLEVLDDEKALRDEEHAYRKKHKENQEIIRKNCETARSNLANLHQGGQKRFRTPSGEIKYLTEEERARRIEEANKQIKEYCKE